MLNICLIKLRYVILVDASIVYYQGQVYNHWVFQEIQIFLEQLTILSRQLMVLFEAKED